MELTLDEALKKGVEAHQAGEIQEAERLYSSVLKAQPNHPDANHKMGILVFGEDRMQEALAFFKIALEADPNMGEYWLNYIDVLLELDKLDDAKAVFDQAKHKGAKGEAFDQIEQQLLKQGLQANKSNILDTTKLDKALRLAKRKLKDGLLEEAKSIYEDIIQKFPKHKQALISLQSLTGGATTAPQDPPLEQLQSVINIYNQGQLKQALSHATEMLERFPKSVALYNIAGASNAGLMQLDAAIESYKQAIKIKPDYTQAYYNMGNVLKDKGNLDAAIDIYKQAIKIKPDFADAYYNMGHVLQNKGDLNAAVASFKQAIKIKPDYFEAYNNMGHALQNKGDLNAAVASFKQAIKIKPDYVEAYNNMGRVLFYKGDLEASIDSYKQALKIDSEYDRTWNSLNFPLQAIKLHAEEPLSSLTSQIGSKRFQTSKSILNYKLHLGGEYAERSLNDVCSLLSTADNTIIRNPEMRNNQSRLQTIGPDKIIALVHFGRSGTGLLHSLIDGHPKVSTLPSIYFSEFFNHSAWEKIVAGGWNEMVDRFIETYEVLFDASARNPIESQDNQPIDYLGQKEGMANVGNQRDEVLSVDKALFREELHRLMNVHNHLDAFVFFKLVHAAYDKSLNDHAHKHLIFYHIHNPDVPAKLNFVHAAPNAKWVMMVREPLQACEAWVRRLFDKNEHTQIFARVIAMLFELDNVIYHKQSAIGVRLEDLKESPRKTIPALCDWMGIEETESLYEMTAQGKKWWGDPLSPDYEKDGMKPFGQTSIKRKVGSVFTENDQFVLRTLFYPFSVRFGYVKENIEQFKADLKTIRPMLDEMFGFEKTMAERTQVDAEQFMKSGSYLYLRSGLIDRWNVLSKFHTYPNMIKPLKINQ